MQFKSLSVALFCGAALLTTGCDVMRQMGSAYAMTQCTYAFHSVSTYSIMDIDLGKQLSPLDLLKITPLLTGAAKSVPMKFTMNIDISNPNGLEAGLQGMQYILSIDGLQFTTGELRDRISIPAFSTNTMPLTLGFDLATLLSGSSKDAVVNIVRNLAGIGNAQSKVKLEIKPSFRIGNQVMTSPMYIPLEFTL
ncbi:MAG: LEA type 2 family protein [Bacteroidales bacterium]|nr:LEA type 2 family protein [Bacteroidales bacterium]MCL2739431.1 LEA type 2 family protein [Bacteroidales bacterium]